MLCFLAMNYYHQIDEKLRTFDGQVKAEVNRDLGPGTVFKLIGRNGLIFARGPFSWEFNADAKIYGGAFISEMRAWCFTSDIKPTVQYITRKACDLTVKRQRFLCDRRQTALVRKRLNESDGTLRFCEIPEVSIIFFRSMKQLPSRVLNDLKFLAKIKWCAYTESWYTSVLYAKEFHKIINDYVVGSEMSEVLF